MKLFIEYVSGKLLVKLELPMLTTIGIIVSLIMNLVHLLTTMF